MTGVESDQRGRRMLTETTTSRMDKIAAQAPASLLLIVLDSRLVLQPMFNIPAAWMAERYGRRPLLIFGPLLTSCGMVLTAASSTLMELFGTRCANGAVVLFFSVVCVFMYVFIIVCMYLCVCMYL